MVFSPIHKDKIPEKKTRKYALDYKQIWIELPVVLNGTETREITKRL